MNKSLTDQLKESRQQYERDPFYAEDNERRMTEAQRRQRERGQYEFEPERNLD